MTDEIKMRMEEDQSGTEVYSVPFPEDISKLKEMSPILIKWPWEQEYIHSYAQDSPWFAALANGKLLGTKCPACSYTCVNPRLACPECGAETDWVELPKQGYIHSFTVCHFGAEKFLPECPFVLALIEWPEANTLLLTRLLPNS